MTRTPPPGPSDRQPDNLAQGLVNVIDAALGVGAAMARAAAHATARGAPVTEVAAETQPLAAIIHYGMAATGNMVSLVSEGMGGAFRPRPAASGASTSSSSPASAPRVRPGATLRVPLSVENPSDRPMEGLTPHLRAIRQDGVEVPLSFVANAIRFLPATFSVAPRDFEKLTILIDLPENTPAGRYELVMALGPQEPDLPLLFDVVANDDDSGGR